MSSHASSVKKSKPINVSHEIEIEHKSSNSSSKITSGEISKKVLIINSEMEDEIKELYKEGSSPLIPDEKDQNKELKDEINNANELKVAQKKEAETKDELVSLRKILETKNATEIKDIAQRKESKEEIIVLEKIENLLEINNVTEIKDILSLIQNEKEKEDEETLSENDNKNFSVKFNLTSSWKNEPNETTLKISSQKDSDMQESSDSADLVGSFHNVKSWNDARNNEDSMESLTDTENCEIDIVGTFNITSWDNHPKNSEKENEEAQMTSNETKNDATKNIVSTIASFTMNDVFKKAIESNLAILNSLTAPKEEVTQGENHSPNEEKELKISKNEDNSNMRNIAVKSEGNIDDDKSSGISINERTNVIQNSIIVGVNAIENKTRHENFEQKNEILPNTDGKNDEKVDKKLDETEDNPKIIESEKARIRVEKLKKREAQRKIKEEQLKRSKEREKLMLDGLRPEEVFKILDNKNKALEEVKKEDVKDEIKVADPQMDDITVPAQESEKLVVSPSNNQIDHELVEDKLNEDTTKNDSVLDELKVNDQHPEMKVLPIVDLFVSNAEVSRSIEMGKASECTPNQIKEEQLQTELIISSDNMNNKAPSKRQIAKSIKAAQVLKIKEREQQKELEISKAKTEANETKMWLLKQIKWENQLSETLAASKNNGGNENHPVTLGMSMEHRTQYDPEKYLSPFHGYKYQKHIENIVMTDRSNKTSRSHKNSSRTSREVKVLVDTTKLSSARSESSTKTNDENKSAKTSSRSIVVDPMTGLPKYIQDPFSGEEMEANPSTGRYSSRSNPFPPGSARLSGRLNTGRSAKSTVQSIVASKKMSVVNAIMDVRIDEMLQQQTFERKNCLDDLLGPFRYRLELDNVSCENWHPVCKDMAMIQRRKPTEKELEMDFSCFHPVWHLYTTLRQSHTDHLPHNYITQHKIWHPVCLGYAMIYENKGPCNFESIHPTFACYRTDHWLELQPDPIDQLNPVAKLTMTHCVNAPNVRSNSRFKWDAAITNPIFVGYCPHVFEESPNIIDHELHPSLQRYDLHPVQRWYQWQISPIFFGYKYNAEEIAEVLEKASMNKGVTIKAELSDEQIKRHTTRCPVCHAKIPGCPGCFVMPKPTKIPGFNGLVTPPIEHTNLVDESSVAIARQNLVFMRLYIKAIPSGNVTVITVDNKSPLLYIYFLYRNCSGNAGTGAVHLVLPTNKGVWFLFATYEPNTEMQTGITNGMLSLEDYHMTKSADVTLFNMGTVQPRALQVLAVYYKQNLLLTNEFSVQLKRFLDNLPLIVPELPESSKNDKANVSPPINGGKESKKDYDEVQCCLVDYMKNMVIQEKEADKGFRKEADDKHREFVNAILKEKMAENLEVKASNSRAWVSDRNQRREMRDEAERVAFEAAEAKRLQEEQRLARKLAKLARARGDDGGDSSTYLSKRKNTLAKGKKYNNVDSNANETIQERDNNTQESEKKNKKLSIFSLLSSKPRGKGSKIESEQRKGGNGDQSPVLSLFPSVSMKILPTKVQESEKEESKELEAAIPKSALALFIEKGERKSDKTKVKQLRQIGDKLFSEAATVATKGTQNIKLLSKQIDNKLAEL